MSADETNFEDPNNPINKFNNFLIAHSGITSRWVQNRFFVPDEANRQEIGFFEPFESPLDALASFGSIITGPLALGVLAIENLIFAILYAIDGIVELIRWDTSASSTYFGNTGYYLLGAGIDLLAAAFSPLINLINALGSSCSSLSNKFGAGDDGSASPSLA